MRFKTGDMVTIVKVDPKDPDDIISMLGGTYKVARVTTDEIFPYRIEDREGEIFEFREEELGPLRKDKLGLI